MFIRQITNNRNASNKSLAPQNLNTPKFQISIGRCMIIMIIIILKLPSSMRSISAKLKKRKQNNKQQHFDVYEISQSFSSMPFISV